MKKDQFQKIITTEKLPLVVDFWAPWCGPCKITTPILEKISNEFSGKVKFFQINADDSQELLKELRIFGIPTVVAYKDGKEFARLVGAKPAQQFHSFFQSLAEGKPIKAAKMSLLSGLLRLIGSLAFIYLGWQGDDPIFYALGALLLISLAFSLYTNRK